jgi:chloramphenicol-sensitive protein RarD
MENRKHFAAGLVAFLIWGFFAFPLRALSGYSSGQILYFRILCSVLVLAIIIAGFKRKQLAEEIALLKSFTRKKRNTLVVLTLAGGALLTVNWLTFIHIVNNINIKTASFSYLVCPVLTAVLGSLLLKEKLTKQQWFSVALCAVSCALIGMGSALELGFSFLTALTYALYLITQRRNQGFDRIIVLGVQVLFALILLSALLPVLVTEIPTAPKFYSVILIIAVVFTVLPLFLNLYALNRVNAATIGIVMYLNPILNFTIAVLFFNEGLAGVQVFGYVIIFIALIIFNYSSIKKIAHV